jgi:starvation-inducible DNA-binding protein
MSKSIESTQELERRQEAPLITPTDLKAGATRDIAGAMNSILADVFALYLKTKNFHWHMSGPHFRDYHLLLDEQGDQLFAMTDPVKERIRKIGGNTLRSIGHIARLRRVSDNDAHTSSRKTCSLSCVRIARHSPRACAKPTVSAKNMMTLLLPV